MEHPIESLMKTTMDSLKEMVDVNTIIGDAIETKDGNVVIPISRVSMGFASGGTEFNKDAASADNRDDYPFGGGSGVGMSVQPVAFLIINKDQVKLLPVNQANSLERIVDSVPELLDEIIKAFKNGKSNNKCGNNDNAQ